MHVPSYSGPEGPIQLDRIPTPLKLFFYFLPEALWENLRDDTNHEIYEGGNKIVFVTRQELKIYAAVLLHMMIHPRHELHWYWSLEEEYGSPWIRKCMPRKRWMDIHHYITFGPYLWESLLCHLSRNIYILGDSMSVDEGIVPFLGEHQDRVTIRGKPHDTGALHYSCVDGHGYLHNMRIRVGRKYILKDVVLELVAPFKGCWRHLFTDNLYTSLALVTELHHQHIKFTGTVRQHNVEELFVDYLHPNLEHGRWISVHSGPIVACSYSDVH